MKTGGSFYDTNGLADRPIIEWTDCQKVKSCQDIVDWRKLHKKQHVSAFFGKSVLKCHLT